MKELRRATSVDEYLEKRPKFVSEAGHAYADTFVPRPSDVIIATFPKCGTTWMQQIVHGLRTNGDMDFGEITEAVPWIEMAYDLGIDLNAPQKGAFRAFKVHHTYDTVPKGARYIWVMRDPKDVALSFYNFMNGWLIEPGTVSVDEFVQEVFLGDYLYGSYWAYLLSWWQVKDHENVLVTSFEDMKADLQSVVGKIANFINCPDTAEIAIKQASFKFMKDHEPQFDDHLVPQARNTALGLPKDVGATKVSIGHVGSAKQGLSAETINMLDARWSEIITPKLGFETYDALRKAV
ncbi:sulfotransferase domain-containing protein [Kordiimonas aquimaris]|uniref:sulfotransferase domain-containing protein n=1 Tax=Kordiimonas aquimaris TaxID=707591 RepID=UPI0021D1E98F|nr:sulfotransferase domain-containing protein [Kordiimonas aquimaris]